ncbi:MAG: DEAD/DEAH box helicase [Proteobacteria bacterium]|nr:DEAD/DEAH box helicase [Pseudomonadota bacterium]
MGLIEPLLRAVAEQGYTQPTPIQVAAIPYVLHGRDLLGCAQTGTGKTAAFALPILQRLALGEGRGRGIRALILTPTRELALQIEESFKDYGRYLSLKSALVYGGVGIEPQRRALAARPDIVIATPGRLLDLMGQGCVKLDALEIFVLDEADRMLDMGFIHDVKRVISALPKERQNLLFSATMPAEIQELTKRILHDPAKVEVTPVSSTAERIDQAVYYVDRPNKRFLLMHVLGDDAVKRALVFTRTKAIANRVAGYLNDNGVTAEAIHGNKSQSARQRALTNFKSGTTRILVASDLAARGIDIDEVTHVINYDVPNVAETYVHRIGRTGRAAASGIAVSFCDPEEKSFIIGIERLIRKKIPVVSDHPFPMTGKPDDSPQAAPSGRSGGGGRRPQRSAGPGGRPQGSGGQRRSRGGQQGGRPQGAPGGSNSNKV